MDIAISHITALEELRHLACTNVRLPESARFDLPPKASAAHLEAAIANLQHIWQPNAEPPASNRPTAGTRLAPPVDILVSCPEARRNSESLRCHIWSVPIPAGAFLELAPGVRLSSPEFTFLQMADSLGVPQLIQLGYELCGRYAFRPAPECGCAKTARPLTTPGRISAFLASAPTCRGRKKALHAAKFILANSWSPMETDLSILLTLPTKSGGYQLPAPLLNRQVPLTGEHRMRARKECYYLDLSWMDRNSRIHALEYQGHEDHSDAIALGRDRTREIILHELGIHHFAITQYQLFRLEELDTVVKAICKSIGRKYRKPTPSQMSRKRQLRQDLFARFGPDTLIS